MLSIIQELNQCLLYCSVLIYVLAWAPKIVNPRWPPKKWFHIFIFWTSKQRCVRKSCLSCRTQMIIHYQKRATSKMSYNWVKDLTWTTCHRKSWLHPNWISSSHGSIHSHILASVLSQSQVDSTFPWKWQSAYKKEIIRINANFVFKKRYTRIVVFCKVYLHEAQEHNQFHNIEMGND